jgi:hypothetical protein
MHCSISFVVIFVCLGAANAEVSLRGVANQLRELATQKKVSICSKVSEGKYETRSVNRWTSSMAETSTKGSCSANCKSLCAEFASFETSNNKCNCVKAAAAQTVAADPCEKSPCGSNQLCINTGASFTCEPMKCANPYGNPCGPASACKDTATGFTCTSLLGSDICPAGCGPNSQCVSGQCRCDTGFSRPKPYLGCVANP